jgi:predicted Zn-dependent protease
MIVSGLIARTHEASAQGGGLIRDTEIERTIRTFATPLFGAGGLSPDAVDIYILNNDQVNAFVAAGQNIFIHTGLLLRTEHPGQLIGVLAHETGHIAGGHLARTADALRGASNAALLSMILGAAAAIASGRGDAAAAIISGGSQIAERTFLSYSRGQEQAADQAGLRYLDANGLSAQGLLEFFNVLEGQELLSTERQSSYVRTHPLTRDRVAFVREHVAASPNTSHPIPPEWVEMHARIVAKLYAYLETPGRTLRRYPDSDKSFAARYARAVALFRSAEIDRAITAMDELLAEKPDDPYLLELKGQILFEGRRPEEALAPLRRALELLPDAMQIGVQLARVQLALDRPETNAAALEIMRDAIRHDRNWPFAWRQLAIAYGRTGDQGMSALALAEEAVLLGRLRDAGLQAKRAQSFLKEGAPGWLRALDIEELAKRELKK